MQAYAADDGLACHNLIMLLAYCYSAGLVAADCMYRCVWQPRMMRPQRRTMHSRMGAAAQALCLCSILQLIQVLLPTGIVPP